MINLLSKRKREEKKERRKKRNESDDEETLSENDLINPFADLLKKDTDVFKLGNHIYFNTDVSMKSVDKLNKIIFSINKEVDTFRTSPYVSEIVPKPIYLHFTSLGGDLFAGFKGIDIIQNSKIPIYTVVDGYAMSAAATMYLAGTKRYMARNSYLLLHQLSSSQPMASYEQLKDEHFNNTKLMDHLYKFYIKASNNTLTLKKIKELMKRDINWDYDVCKSYGLVDDIYENI
jgi:ATP-dependent protease ClpP protease subunit